MTNRFLNTAVAMALLLAFFLGWYVKGKFVDAALLKAYRDQIEITQLAQKTANDRAAQLESTLAAERQTAKATNSKLEKALAKHPDSFGCKLPADGVQLINDAIAAGNPG